MEVYADDQPSRKVFSQNCRTKRELLCTKNAWVWGPEQERPFSNIKEELTQPTVLAIYDPDAETKISADASSLGLGAILLQKSGQEWKPVAYASCSLTELKGDMRK